MVSIQTSARIGADGRLDIEMPVEYREKNVNVTIIVEPVDAAENGREPADNKQGWPAAFFEQTAGAWQGKPLTRGEQGSYKAWEPLLLCRNM